jgi:hypothetical protein
MSEYQYYEFVAIDQPLSADEQADLRAISTRALITPTSFVNHYEWGDLKADPRRLVVMPSQVVQPGDGWRLPDR